MENTLTLNLYPTLSRSLIVLGVATGSLLATAQESVPHPATSANANANANVANLPASRTQHQGAPLAPSLAISNVFDSQRKVWPDRVPPPPPPPPPPAPTPVTDGDLELYGVVIAGHVKRATVKTGPRFADVGTNPRGFAALSEGQSLGEFTVASILPTHIILAAPGGQQAVYFTKKNDRATVPTLPSANAVPVQAPTDTTPRDTGTGHAPSGANSPPPGTTGSTAPRNPPISSGNAPQPSAPPQAAVSPPVSIQNTLAAAIAAAQSNPSARPSTTDILNPFAPQR